MTDKQHPLDNFSMNIKSIKCFTKNGSGKFHFAPISFIIGKNNTGKSAILDTLQCLSYNKPAQAPQNIFTKFKRQKEHPFVEITARPMANLLGAQFPKNSRGGDIPSTHGTYWDYGKKFLGDKVYMVT